MHGQSPGGELDMVQFSNFFFFFQLNLPSYPHCPWESINTRKNINIQRNSLKNAGLGIKPGLRILSSPSFLLGSLGSHFLHLKITLHKKQDLEAPTYSKVKVQYCKEALRPFITWPQAAFLAQLPNVPVQSSHSQPVQCSLSSGRCQGLSPIMVRMLTPTPSSV